MEDRKIVPTKIRKSIRKRTRKSTSSSEPKSAKKDEVAQKEVASLRSEAELDLTRNEEEKVVNPPSVEHNPDIEDSSTWSLRKEAYGPIQKDIAEARIMRDTYKSIDEDMIKRLEKFKNSKRESELVEEVRSELRKRNRERYINLKRQTHIDDEEIDIADIQHTRRNWYNYSYDKIDDIVAPKRRINIYGIVCDFSSDPKVTNAVVSYPKKHITFKILDESTLVVSKLPKVLSVTMFGSLEKLPLPLIKGQIIRMHRVDAKEFRGEIHLNCDDGIKSSWVLFDPKESTEIPLAYDKSTYNWTESDSARLKALKTLSNTHF